jgi:GT2 family glycosyltransferase
MASPTLSIVIVNWNGLDVLPHCLNSISKNPPSCAYEIIVVDNGSWDGSRQWLCQEWFGTDQSLERKRRLIENHSNLGYGPASNLAFEQTISPILLVLNSDTRIEAGALDKMLETITSDDKIGVVGPKLLNDDGSLQPSVCRYPQSPASIIIDGLRLDRIVPKGLLARWLYGASWAHDQRTAVPVVSGAAMMCKRSMIDEVGGFDPSIHMYAEELDWCVRIRRHGWKIYFEPDASIYHTRAVSTARRWTEAERIIVQEKALISFESKLFSPLLNFINSFTKIILLSVHCLRWEIRKRNTLILRMILHLHKRNCIDQLGSIFGQKHENKY